MKSLNLISAILLLCIFFPHCKKESKKATISCDQNVIVNANDYDTTSTASFGIDSLEINGDCLKIRYGSSGCDGSSWVISLIDSESVMESAPPQRNLRFVIKNNEVCAAYFVKEITFDISALQVKGNQVWLNITNSDDRILYEY